MRNTLVPSLSLLLLATAAPAFGGAVYVPFTGDVTVGGVRYRTQVSAANRSDADRRFKTVLINAGSNGLDREGVEPVERTVLAGTTILVQDLASPNQLGMLEVDGAPQLAIAARLVPVEDLAGGLGADLPVVSSENLVAAGVSIHVQGMARDDHQVTDFVLVNIAQAQASCKLTTVGANGAQLGAVAQVTLPPLSVNRYADVLGTLEPLLAHGVRVVANCDQTFYAFGLTFDSLHGGVKVLRPAERLSSTLTIPGDTSNPACPGGARCFSKLGTFFTQTPPAIFHIEYFDVPPGNYSKVRLQVEVFHGGWGNLSGPGGLHSLFWLVRDRNFNLLGFSVFRKPPKNDVMFRHGVGIPATQKPKIFIPVEGVPGHSYLVDYTYDPGHGTLNYKLTDLTTGTLLIDYDDVPNVNRVEVPEGSRLRADFGFKEGLNENEDPGYGWRYSNLKVEVHP